MGVLLEGLNMPKGSPITINIYRDGTWVNAYTTEDGNAIEVTTPHGDLIDRNVLADSLSRLCKRVCQYSEKQRQYMCGSCPLGDAFPVVEDDAPGVIEAEDGE